MKSLIMITLFALSCYSTIGQTTIKKTQAKKTASKNKSFSASRQNNGSTTSITPAIDSFKRSNRYSPGRPYGAAPANTTANSNDNTSSAKTINSNSDSNPANGSTSAGVNNNPLINNNNVINNNTQQNIPQSPSNERNHADINQRQLNENSKNAISDMSSGQVNALNQNQMAPPPQNWGNNQAAENKWGRNTVGESQWTPNTTVSSSFSRDFPTVTGATWIRDNRDTMNYSARFKTGDYWSNSTYNSTGAHIDTRTELPLGSLPRPVALYGDKQRVKNIKFERVTRVERPSKAELYEVRLSTGSVVYVNRDGVETEL